MISAIISRLVILVFGTLYPAYASYKAVRTKNLKEYVKWMMYWIVFALFTCTETFTDVFLSWFPFYYEVKIVLVLWLLSPATKGSSILYRKFVHPALCRREQEIDEYIAKAKDQGYHTVLNLGTKGVNYATTVIMQTAIKGGGGLVQQLRKSYSLSDLTECEPREERASDEADDVLAEPRLIRRGGKRLVLQAWLMMSYSLSDLTECEPREERGSDEADDVLAEPRLIRRGGKSPGYSTRRSASESNSRSPMYFPEVDVDVRTTRPNRTDEPDFSHIKSSEDISSGYSSADNSASLPRAASLGAGRARARVTRTAVTAIKRPQAAEESEVIIEELHDDDSFEYANMPPLVNLPPQIFLSRTDPPFLYQYIGDQVKVLQVLGNDHLNLNINKETNADTQHWDQREKEVIEDIKKKAGENDDKSKQDDSIQQNQSQIEIGNVLIDTTANVVNDDNNNNKLSIFNKESSNDSFVDSSETPIPLEKDNLVSDNVLPDQSLNKEEEHPDTTSLETSAYDNDSAESDDEASYGTPENSPKAKRKSPKGKYGKSKAPPPPKLEIPKDMKAQEDNKTLDTAVSTTSQESLNDMVNMMSNTTFKESAGSKAGLQVVNPIAEKKRRHKSKSPGRIPKVQGSGIGKLLQLPNKLAFWHKNEDKTKSDGISTSSDDCSRRSSTIEKPEDYENCQDSNLENVDSKNSPPDVSDDQSNFMDACDIDSEVMSSNIIEKSDALQKLIEAKIESHPEYKFVSLHDEIPTSSKSTDV